MLWWHNMTKENNLRIRTRNRGKHSNSTWHYNQYFVNSGDYRANALDMTGAVHRDNAGLGEPGPKFGTSVFRRNVSLFQFQQAVTHTTPFETGNSMKWKQWSVWPESTARLWGPNDKRSSSHNGSSNEVSMITPDNWLTMRLLLMATTQYLIDTWYLERMFHLDTTFEPNITAVNHVKLIWVLLR